MRPLEVRRSEILTLIQQQGFVRVIELADLFDVSEVTIRSDLDDLAGRGHLRRVRGGAIASGMGRLSEPTFEESEQTLHEEKAAIGRAAASLVTDGETLAIDVGTTTTAFAAALARRTDLRDVVVFTNGLTIALELEAAADRFTIVVTGGTLRPRQHSLVDPMANEILGTVRVHTTILGCNGVHASGGVTNVNLAEASVKQRMVEIAERTIVLADGSKLGKVTVAKITDLDAVDLLITGSSAPREATAKCEELGLPVIVAT